MNSQPLRFDALASSGAHIMLLGGIALGAGFIQGSSVAIALGLALVIVPLCSLMFLRRSVRSLRLRQVAPDCAVEGEWVEVQISLENTGRWPVFHPRLCEIFSPEHGDLKDVVLASRVSAHETVTASYRGHCLGPRGLYDYGPTALRLSDPFGWFEIRQFLASGNRLKVYPRFALGNDGDRLGRERARFLEEVLQSTVGHSSEFFGVRDYRPGDSRRQVHWPLSARRGTLVVRETMREQSGEIILVLDRRPASNARGGTNSSFERSIRLVASIAARALKNGRRPALVVGLEAPLRPLGNRSALSHFLDELVLVRADGRTGLDQTLDHLAQGLTGHPSVFVVIHRHALTEPAVCRSLAALSARGATPCALVMLPHPQTKDSDFEPDLRAFLGNLQARGTAHQLVPHALVRSYFDDDDHPEPDDGDSAESQA
ncbi:MAG: DUF58 domain-containing protein [Planctomycetes bacterium]|nr:DUF58 domain-containing protein [Planctomycetota bacterium]